MNFLLKALALILPALATLGAAGPSPAEASTPTPTPLRVAVSTEGFKDDDLPKLERAVALLERAVNRPEFRERVLDFEWNGERRYAENQGLTNDRILARILAAEERWRPGEDATMHLRLRLYRSRNPWSGVPGWTRKDDELIRINAHFFRRPDWTPADVAGNLAHEWLHQLGFTHAYRATSERPFTVPYAIGEIVRTLAAEEADRD